MDGTYLPYQERAKQFALDRESCALWLDMGLGKSVITLGVVQDWLDGGEIHKTLIVAPPRVVDLTWPAEVEKFGFRLRVSAVTGSAAQRKAALQRPADVYLISYHNLKWLSYLLKNQWPFDCVVFDEAHFMKNNASQRLAAFRKCRHRVNHVIELTGTPAASGLTDLWPQILLLDGGERLGKTVTSFRQRWFDYNPYAYSYTPKDGARAEITRLVDDLALSMSREDYLTLPDLVPVRVPVRLPLSARKTYNEMRKDMVLALKDEHIIANRAVLSGKCQQVANGIVYFDDAPDRQSAWLHDAKYDALDEILAGNEGQPVMVVYWFQSEYDRLLQKYAHARVLKTATDLADWNAGRIPMLLIHPMSGGYGLNLQTGGHIIVWFAQTWSLRDHDQTIGRLQRRGQAEPVRVFYIVAENTVDDHMLDVMRGRATVQDALLAAVQDDGY